MPTGPDKKLAEVTAGTVALTSRCTNRKLSALSDRFESPFAGASKKKDLFEGETHGFHRSPECRYLHRPR